MNKKFPPSILMIALVFSVFMGVAIDKIDASPKKESKDSFYESVDLVNAVMQRINYGYVEQIDMNSFVKHAIKGGLEILDPHTTFFEPKGYDELMVHTEGEFGGLGIQISIRDKILTVMTPISGTPADRAGIRSGDKIIKIEGESTKGISLEDAVDKMRGKPGTSVKITIVREGESQPIEYEIERAIIKIKSVPFVGIVKDSIGYLKLNSFSQDAGEMVRRGVDSLVNMGAKGIVFDLRYNPGGLLDQARDVASVFLPKDKLVVFTKGRMSNSNDSLFTRDEPALPADMPVLVMVNGGSASAAEIVSGAIQDWDRGVIFGDTTYGKGSVQTVFPVGEDYHLKMTIAFYYTPSGRCINKPENGIRGDEEDSTESEDSVKIKDEQVFYTNDGRPVYGGGGIIPDSIYKEKPEPYLVRKLMLKDIFFKFANNRVPSLVKNGAVIDTNFVVTDDLLNDFYTYLDSTDFDYSLYAEDKLKDFRVFIGQEKDTTVDTTLLNFVETKFEGSDSTEMASLLAKVDNLLKKKRADELQKEVNEIKRLIRIAFIVHEIGEDNDYIFRNKLDHDDQLMQAISLIKDKAQYESKLKKSNVK